MPRSTALTRSLRRALRPLAVLALLAPLAAQAPYAGNVPPAAPSVTRDAALNERIEAVLRRPHLRRTHWGIEVRDAQSGRVLYARDADKLFIPASNLKLVVAAAAAHHLDPEFRYRTTLHATGPVRGGALQGDLVVRGSGDPTISGRYFDGRTAVLEGLADSLRARGIRRITGGIVADESAWDAEYVRGDWEAYDLRWWYAAPVGALGFNDNAVDFRVEPGAGVGQPARISGSPASAAYTLVNATTTVARGRPHTLDFERVPGTDRIRAYGQIPLGTATRTESFAVREPARWLGTVFREVLAQEGITVGRREVHVVSHPAASPAAGAAALVEYRSPPLPRVIGPILLNSQNWFAEQLAKTLGREVRGEGSWSAGLAVERDFLSRVVGIDSADFVLRDASGLSSGNLVTPRALVALLDHVRRTPRQRIVREALPVSGRSGSLQRRLEDLPGRVAAKTGYIGNVDTLSGFLTLADGREVVFSILANGSGQPSSRMKEAIDDIVRAVAATP
ncbi:MAG TPA: D-alanyl-D-alanine carboxypeptidase/D-alanyl-D-alanine-endopeptidase [Longimicrobium sp.]|nr:D-alanyl-D-alanine carboxypeptidase/D-alanyl-D-alanine-endopeptidase [Longimicrobium sp.]